MGGKGLHFVLTLLFSALLLLVPVGAALAASYTVVPGDSLYKIGQRFNVSVQDLRSANGLGSSSRIDPGQKLTIPSKGNVYTVRRGDTLFKIAQRHGVSVDETMRVNGLRSSVLHPGQKLVIPSRASASVSRGLPVLSGRVTSASASDFDLLARLITAEADNQAFEVKVAVGAVILNRVRSYKFPNTISAVIYDRTWGRVQFEPVLNGWINRPASPEARRAAREALNGWDPSYGATFFFEPWVSNRFLHALPVARRLGAFTFAYAR
jgi:LysM repeat protein